MLDTLPAGLLASLSIAAKLLARASECAVQNDPACRVMLEGVVALVGEASSRDG